MAMTKSEEQMRSEIKRLPVEHLEKLGSVSAPKSPLPCAPFESQAPFQLDPSDFFEAVEIADALIAGTEIGEEIIDFSRPMLMETK